MLPPLIADRRGHGRVRGVGRGSAVRQDGDFVQRRSEPRAPAIQLLRHQASGIDQEPFGIVFHGDTPARSGVLVHHGSWVERTMPAPPQFWEALAASGIGNCYPFSGLPTDTAGPISRLNVPSQHGAFGTLVDQLKGSLISGG